MSEDTQKRLQRMAQLTAMVLDATLLEAKEAVAARREVEAKLRTLDADRRRVAEAIDDPAFHPGADILWNRWADCRRAELNKAIARELVSEDQARRQAARAFGRNQALGKVIDRAKSRGT